MITDQQKNKLADYIREHSWQECLDMYQTRCDDWEHWRVYDFWQDLGHGDDMLEYNRKVERMNLDKEILDYLKNYQQKLF